MPILLQLAQSYSNPDSVNYKIAYLREQLNRDLGKLAYEDQVQVAMLGETVIIGGFLNTELIAADSILTNHLAAKAVTSDKIDVNTLSAISANIGDVTAGSLTGVTITGSIVRTAASGTRAEMGGGNTPYFDTYLGNIKRMRLESDRLNFYDENGTWGGHLISQVYSDNYPAISLIGNRVAEIKSNDSPPGGKEKTAAFLTETMPGDLPKAHAVTYDDETGAYSAVRLDGNVNIVTFSGDIILYPMFGEILLDGDGIVHGSFTVNGTKAALVETENYGRRKLYAVESPDNRFMDIVETSLDPGEHWIELNPMFAETINGYSVFPIAQDGGQVRVLEKEPLRFRLKVSGDDPVEVACWVYGKRKGYEDVYMEEVIDEEIHEEEGGIVN